MTFRLFTKCINIDTVSLFLVSEVLHSLTLLLKYVLTSYLHVTLCWEGNSSFQESKLWIPEMVVFYS